MITTVMYTTEAVVKLKQEKKIALLDLFLVIIKADLKQIRFPNLILPKLLKSNSEHCPKYLFHLNSVTRGFFTCWVFVLVLDGR